jgi:hypothetical protein
MSIGFTEAWLGGKTVDLGFSHEFFCWHPPTSRARSGCEAGAYAQVPPPSGPIVSPIWDIVPLGFTPPQATLHCPKPGHCIGQPGTIDLSRVASGDSNSVFPAHSQILVEDESFQSTWWPVVIVGVKNLSAWNQLVAAKSWDALYACQLANNCTPDRPTNAYEWFQVLGPGMSPGGPD